MKASNRASLEGSHVYNSHPAGDLIICFIYCRVTLVPTHQTMGSNQRHILRDRRPGTTACLSCWAMGTHKVKKCAVRKKFVFCWAEKEQQRQDKNLLYWQTTSTNQQKDPFHL